MLSHNLVEAESGPKCCSNLNLYAKSTRELFIHFIFSQCCNRQVLISDPMEHRPSDAKIGAIVLITAN